MLPSNGRCAPCRAAPGSRQNGRLPPWELLIGALRSWQGEPPGTMDVLRVSFSVPRSDPAASGHGECPLVHMLRRPRYAHLPPQAWGDGAANRRPVFRCLRPSGPSTVHRGRRGGSSWEARSTLEAGRGRARVKAVLSQRRGCPPWVRPPRSCGTWGSTFRPVVAGKCGSAAHVDQGEACRRRPERRRAGSSGALPEAYRSSRRSEAQRPRRRRDRRRLSARRGAPPAAGAVLGADAPGCIVANARAIGACDRRAGVTRRCCRRTVAALPASLRSARSRTTG